MSKKQDSNNYKKFLLFLTGCFVLILGVTMILSWFDAVVILFKGGVGIALGLAGLFMLYAINKL